MDNNFNKQNILIISHSPFSKNFNMGRTLESYFHGWKDSHIAQLYFRPDKPSGELCHDFYQFTDSDAIKSIFIRWHSGRIYKDYFSVNDSLLMNKGKLKFAYDIGLKKKPFITRARNILWSLSGWHNKALKSWIDMIDPKIIFFAAGDYSFSYKIALKIAKKRNIPLIICCFDDYYIYDSNNKGIIGKSNHKELIRWAKEAVHYSNKLIVTNELMAKDYKVFFHVDCPILYTSSSMGLSKIVKQKNQIVYLGNVGLGRYEKLVEFGRRLKTLGAEGLPDHIDVYSSIEDIAKYPLLNKANGIVFHGAVPYTDVKNIINESLAILHVESTNEAYRKRVHYSLSTKIADSLGSCSVLIAYGPTEVASFQYLIENNCAIVIGEDDDFASKLMLLKDEKERKKINERANDLFNKNHIADRNSSIVRHYINDCLSETGE